jgi:hypothetical protein
VVLQVGPSRGAPIADLQVFDQILSHEGGPQGWSPKSVPGWGYPSGFQYLWFPKGGQQTGFTQRRFPERGSGSGVYQGVSVFQKGSPKGGSKVGPKSGVQNGDSPNCVSIKRSPKTGSRNGGPEMESTQWGAPKERNPSGVLQGASEMRVHQGSPASVVTQ